MNACDGLAGQVLPDGGIALSVSLHEAALMCFACFVGAEHQGAGGHQPPV